MGGLGPGIGGLEYLVIGIVALLVVGPERLPGMLRQLGRMVGKARGMANEFRASFDEMARQSELDELRKEVQALRDGQGSLGQGMVKLGAEADAAFKDIKTELEKPAAPVAEPPLALGQPEFPEPTPDPVSDLPSPKPEDAAKPRKTPARRQPAKARAANAAEATPAPKAKSKPRTPVAKPASSRAPRNSKIDL